MSDLKPFLKRFLERTFTPGSYCAALQRFLSSRARRGLSPYAVSHLYYSLKPLGDALKNPPLTAVTPRDLKKYVDGLYRKYAVGTIGPVVGDLKQFFAWCRKKRLIEKNPAKRLALPNKKKRRVATGKQKAAPETAVSAVLAMLVSRLRPLVYRDLFGNLQVDGGAWSIEDMTAVRDLFIVSFLYETGGRAGELTGLGAKVMERETAVPKPAYMVTAIGKTNDRDLRFTEKTAELWRLWQQVRPDKENEFAVYGLRPTHDSYTPLTTNAVSLMLVRRCKEANTAVFRAHALRHAKVRRSKKLVGLEMASLLIDHSDIETTRGYAPIELDEVETAVIRTGIQGDLWGN